VVDESRRVHTLAYIPVLDEEYEEVLQLEKPEILPADLAYDAHIETERLHQLVVKVQQLNNAEACRPGPDRAGADAARHRVVAGRLARGPGRGGQMPEPLAGSETRAG
ncbi:MAG TPA: hypothetical protein PK360_14395, partial [bacterium]|nr:hypothetical protein [bacterium]